MVGAWLPPGGACKQAQPKTDLRLSIGRMMVVCSVICTNRSLAFFLALFCRVKHVYRGGVTKTTNSKLIYTIIFSNYIHFSDKYFYRKVYS